MIKDGKEGQGEESNTGSPRKECLTWVYVVNETSDNKTCFY